MYSKYLQPIMETPPSFDSADAVRDLTNAEILAILPTLGDAQRERLAACLDMLNTDLSAQIAANGAEIEAEQCIAQLLLRRVWRNLEPDTKRECAEFFREISDEINGGC